MAYTPCANALGANIQASCSNPPVAGFVGEGILLDKNNVTITATADSQNPRIITALTIGSSDHACVVDNVWRDPFTGSARTMNAENGRIMYDTTLAMRVPNRSAAGAKDIIEPLAKCNFVGLFPMVDGRILVYGYYGKFQASEQTQNEGENGGDWAITMQSSEPYAVVELIPTTGTAKTVYDALKAKAF